MEIIHVSAECYPVAKAGGLGDVVGALPKYQVLSGHVAKVVMPMYRTKFLLNHREKVYGYDDDAERFTAFQIAVVDWISSWKHRPDLVHVHDHHTGLIPFMFKHCYRYQHLQTIPTVLTIHNAQYQGWMGWDKSTYIPTYDNWKRGMLEWQNNINPLASGIKCAWKVTTVSWSYLDELRIAANGLEALFEYEKGKCSGILNGIDTEVWDPATDAYIENHYSVRRVGEGKRKSKQLLCTQFSLDPLKPLIVFIGRLVGEKGADLLPQAIGDSFYYIGRKMNFLILGSGFPEVEFQLSEMQAMSQGDYSIYVGYKSIWRAVELYDDKEKMDEIRERMMKLDFSWETSVQQYLDLYQSLQ